MVKKELYKVFYLDGKEILSYTLRGTYNGEEQATKELLAYEKGVDVDRIKTNIVERKTDDYVKL